MANKIAKQLTDIEYEVLLALYNNCNEAYKTLSEEWKYAFLSRLYSTPVIQLNKPSF